MSDVDLLTCLIPQPECSQAVQNSPNRTMMCLGDIECVLIVQSGMTKLNNCGSFNQITHSRWVIDSMPVVNMLLLQCLQGRSEAEKELQEQLQTLKGQTAAASQDLQASRTAFQQERATWQEQQQAWQAQQAKHAASAKKHEADNLTLVAQQQQQKQQWEAERAQAEADFKCSQAEERESWRRQQQQWETERAQREAQAELEFKRKQHQWEAERAAQAQHAQQLQTEMAAMKADLEQYKAALAAAKHDTGFAQTAGRSGNGTPLTPHTPGHALGGGAPGAGKITEAAASTPGKAV